MTIDILTEKYMDWGPYVFSGNRLIDARELEGMEPLSVHATMDAAAENFGIYFNGPSIGLNEEYGSTIYEVVTSSGIQYAYSVPNIGTGGSSVIPSLAPSGATAVGDIHTHAAYDPGFANNIFSGISSSGSNLSSRTGDIGAFNVLGLIGYITTPNGSLQRYDNISGVISTIGTNMPSDPLAPTRLNTVAPRAPRAPVAPITPISPNPVVPIPVPTPQPDIIPVITPTPAPLPIIIPPVRPDGGN